jgi:hypothetical protein
MANLGKKNSKPTKRWSKILPSLVFTILSNKFFHYTFFSSNNLVIFWINGLLTQSESTNSIILT